MLPSTTPNRDPEQLLEQLIGAAPSRESIEGLLGLIAARIGAPAPRFDEQGLLSLSVADEVALTLVYAEDTPGIVAAAALPEALAGDADLLADLLAANLDWGRTGGATFGKLPQGGPVVLCQLLPVTASDGGDEAASKRLEESLLDFATNAAAWIDDLEQTLDLGYTTRESSTSSAPSPRPRDFA